MIQSKLKSIEDTICWINHEEALFKFPQSSYPDVGDMNVGQISFVTWKTNLYLSLKIFFRQFKVEKEK